ncbi:MAG: cytochrome c [Planctomycetota bacterium]
MSIPARLVCLGLLCCFASCRQDMQDQKKLEPLEKSTFFRDERASRPLVEGTIARGQLREDPHLFEGKVDGQYATTLPFPVDRAVLERGRERYGIFCTPCHSPLGDGNRIVVQRGFKRPPTYHQDRLRSASVGYFFDVITNGYGAMYSFASRIPVEDRWKIVAYVRSLQLSQWADIAQAPGEDRAKLEEER